MPIKIMNKVKQNLLKSNQEILVSFGVALICLFSSFAFPSENSAQMITKNIFFLILLPIAYVKLILGKKLADFGWNLKNPKLALLWSINMTLFTLLLFYLMLNYSQFKSDYVLENYIKNSFWLFLTYELIIVNFTSFIFTAFFQGFLLSLFQKKFEYLSLAISTGTFLMVLLLTKSLSWQTAPFILLSITGGFLTLKTKSFFYSYFMSIFAIIILDAYFIYLTK